MMNPEAIDAHLPFVISLLEGKTAFLEPNYEAAEKKTVNKGGFGYYLKGIDPKGKMINRLDNYDQLPEGSVAVISVNGVITHQDQFCGPMGTRSMEQNIELANSSDNIHGILFLVDSPGGEAVGMESLGQILSKTEKPKVAFVDKMAASAGYWIASQADKIVLNGNFASVGSIGTMIAFADIEPALEKAGVKFHVIRATNSQDKNQEYLNIKEGKYDSTIARLDYLNGFFQAAVKSGRGDKVKEDALTGKMYYGQEAIKLGLADEIGDMNTAYSLLQELIDEKTTFTI